MTCASASTSPPTRRGPARPSFKRAAAPMARGVSSATGTTTRTASCACRRSSARAQGPRAEMRWITATTPRTAAAHPRQRPRSGALESDPAYATAAPRLPCPATCSPRRTVAMSQKLARIYPRAQQATSLATLRGVRGVSWVPSLGPWRRRRPGSRCRDPRRRSSWPTRRCRRKRRLWCWMRPCLSRGKEQLVEVGAHPRPSGVLSPWRQI
mmetsp:Transcript_29377/g.78934  ORF Transcript_29377/g.78934 Transcript_29377/m.78934 type:complete len:211 (-) Transcript_29377:884-1516(-)